MKSTPPKSACVIGCGPGGMFVAHALERKRAEWLAAGRSLSSLPLITIFEKSPAPGGVWRSKCCQSDNEEEKKSTEESTQMYEALWLNAPKENVEFFDYTFQEHFGRALPVYLPRQAVLEYFLARVTKDCPDFFEKYVRFETEVKHVEWIEQEEQFKVTTRNKQGKHIVQKFDACIWAGGENGRPRIPQTVMDSLEGFNGVVIHSSQTDSLKDHVFQKRVVMIGGSYSSEDLSLMSIKLGVSRVFIVSRSEDNVATWMRSWPDDKVEVYSQSMVVSVQNGNCLKLASVEQEFFDKHVPSSTQLDNPKILEDIDTVILCTGYDWCDGMLAENLYACFENSDTKPLEVPEDWKMNENEYTRRVGEVKPGLVLHDQTYFYRDVYRGVINIEIPQMMFILGDDIDPPILMVDMCANFAIQVLSGDITLPPPQEMRDFQRTCALKEIQQYPYLRYYCDGAYFNALEEAYNEDDPEEETVIWTKWMDDAFFYSLCVLAQLARDTKYPVDFGSLAEGLNDHGQRVLQYSRMSTAHRTEALPTKTFRDTDDHNEFVSHFTGMKAVGLKKLWMDVDETTDLDALLADRN